MRDTGIHHLDKPKKNTPQPAANTAWADNFKIPSGALHFPVKIKLLELVPTDNKHMN